MHIFRFPGVVRKKLDQLCRNFLLGHTSSRARIHLISWDKITRPKREGGVGLHIFQDFNIALIGKIAWGLLTRPNDLWAQFLINKYKGGWEGDWILKVNEGDSWLWVSIMKVWNEIKHWLGWGIRNGCRVKFWTYQWVNGKNLLDNIRDGEISEGDRCRPIRDYISSEGEWKWEAFAGKINHSLLLTIASIRPPHISLNSPDFPIWIGSRNEEYSVLATCANLLALSSPSQQSKIWKAIWSWEGHLE